MSDPARSRSPIRHGRTRSLLQVAAGTVTVLILGLVLGPAPAGAAPAARVVVGRAGSFSVLAGVGVVSSGATVVTGDLGVSPGSSVVGFPPGVVGGVTYAGGSVAAGAQVDAVSAYQDAAGRVPSGEFSGDQNGVTFTPGVYHTAAAFALTGTLTLDGLGDPNAVFIFQVSAALNTAAASHLVLVGGAQAANVFWAAQGAVGTGADSDFAGTVLSPAGITIGAGASVTGQLLSQATVTLSGNGVAFTAGGAPAVSITGGAAAASRSATPTITGTTSAPGGTAVTVRIDGGAQVLSTTAGAGGGWSVTAATLANGRHTVLATVKDVDGNNGTATQVLTLNLPAARVVVGRAGSFSVLAGVGVVSSGATVVTGDLGVSPGSSVVGFPPGVVGGVTYAGGSVAAGAQVDAVSAYQDAAGRVPSGEFSGDQNGVTFTPGVYHTAAAFALTGTLTLDGLGDPNAVFIFQVSAALNTAAASHLVLVGGAQAANVFWAAQGAVGTGADSDFAGTVLSPAGITIGAGASVTGQLLSQATVTLSGNGVAFTAGGAPAVSITGGAAAASRSATPTITGTTSAPGGTAVTVRIDGGAQVLSTTAGAGGGWSVTAATLANGRHTVLATVKDVDGNNGTATQVLTLNLPAARVVVGRAGSFSVLAGVGVVSSGATVVTGDLGVSPGSSVVGFPPGVVGGVTYAGGSVAAGAQVDAVSAYQDAAGRVPSGEFSGDQNGVTFTPGVYHTAAAFALTGTLTLDGLGDPNAVFIFQVSAALNTAAASHLVLVGGAQAANVFWAAQGAVGTGADSDFAGTVLSPAGITIGAGASVTGQLLSQATVTLSGNSITTPVGVLSITVPSGPAQLGAHVNTVGGTTISGPLGDVQVTDSRHAGPGAGWVASVSSTAFTSASGGRIPATFVSYAAGAITGVGTATYTAQNPHDLTSAVPAVTASFITGDNSATWNPTITISVPASAVAGTYQATITHSVA